ncbi:MAG TPA: 4Fe-4S binding protein [Anaeromyxobacteraceae bacterium]|nr:4Fe-4S binding protein [Anaeromyxobacteraceae bacterium]
MQARPAEVRSLVIPPARGAPRVGVYVCRCGTNIAGKVDVAEATRFASTLPGVVVARDCMFLCADAGQELIIRDIHDRQLSRVVVASCSPRMHEPTFRGACLRGELNPFLMAMANIREQCSWVTADPRAATQKALALIRGAVARVRQLETLQAREVIVNPATLVIGGGIAGIHASLEIGGAGKRVYLVERSASIGGHMARFDKTFPTLDCAACIVTPKMVSVARSPGITLFTYSEVEAISGHVGAFKVRIRRRARLVNEGRCNGCGLCWEVCPARLVPRERTVLLDDRPIAESPAANTRHAQPKPGVGLLLEKLRKDREKRATEPRGACDLCGLCVRMCRDVVGASVLHIEKRGEPPGRRVVVARHAERCILCGACAEVCHSGHLKLSGGDAAIRHDELLLGPNAAIALDFMQAVPSVPVIDRDRCIHFKTGACGACRDVCDRSAISFDAQDELLDVEVGTIIAATGFKTFDPARLPQYGYGRLENVVTALEFETLSNAAGPTGGRILTASGKLPESVAIIHCVGSRDRATHDHCSRVCCMMALKYAHLVREKTGARVYDFYVDMRCAGKGYEEFYNRLLEEGVHFVRGRAAEVTDFAEDERDRGKLIVHCEDTLLGAARRFPVDMVVLMTGMEPAAGADALQRALTLSRTRDGFFMEQHPKLAPVATATNGVFIAGACQGPKDIPDTVAQAGAAAASALALTVKGKVEIEPLACSILAEQCAGCRICSTMCPFRAIAFDATRNVSVINESACKGCGTCAAACPSGAIRAPHFTERQLLDEIHEVLA